MFTLIVSISWIAADRLEKPFWRRSARAEAQEISSSSDEAKQLPPGASPKAMALAVTRADLAAAYLRLEQAYFTRPPVEETIVRINRGFDQATLAFFIGRNSEAVRAIDELTDSLATENGATAERAAVSLKVVVQPPVWTLDRPVQAIGRVTSIYEWPSSEPIELKLQLRLVNPGRHVVFERAITATVGPRCNVDANVPLELSTDRLQPGLYRIELGPVDGRGVEVGRVSVVDRVSLDEQRVINEKQLAQIESPSPRIGQALATCRARNRLLNDRPSEANSAQFLVDLNALAQEVASEIRILASGDDPYSRRRGDYWRVLQVANGEIPLRVYASEAAIKDEPVPLLVVLHGMGGDENMFPEAYGAGVIKQIADHRGLLIASPLTYRFGGSAKSLDALIEALGFDYALDRDRIYVLGHSLGAGIAAKLARERTESIAAACCIAGGSFQGQQKISPLLVVLPELDMVVPSKTVRAAAEKLAAVGMPIESRMMPGYGHTLAVGAILPNAVDWLLQHRRSIAAQR